ncbi:MAG: hypothetical protein JNJ57_13000 [Saprospiraceae bacterium]|nr:hypothetical protein [Saprospiraceae bacterium]
MANGILLSAQSFQAHEILILMGALFLIHAFGFRISDGKIIKNRGSLSSFLLAGLLLGIGGWLHTMKGTAVTEKAIPEGQHINMANFFIMVIPFEIPYVCSLDKLDAGQRADLIRQAKDTAADSARARYFDCCRLSQSQLADLNMKYSDFVVMKHEKLELDHKNKKSVYKLTACYYRSPFFQPKLQADFSTLNRLRPETGFDLEAMQLPEGLNFPNDPLAFSESEFRLDAEKQAKIALLAVWLSQNCRDRQINEIRCEGFASNTPINLPGIPYNEPGTLAPSHSWLELSENTAFKTTEYITNNDQLSCARAYQGIKHLRHELKKLDDKGDLIQSLQFNYQGKGESGNRFIIFSYR